MKAKSNFLRIFSILIIASMLFTPLSGNVAARDSVSEIAKETGHADVNAAAAETTTYIIQLSDSPLASYNGGVEGLAPTSLSATGASKLSNTPATAAYLSHLESTQASFINAMEQTLGRSVDVTHTYQHAFNGLAAKMTAAEAKRVGSLSGVLMVSRETIEYPLTDAGPAWIGAPAIWDGTATGGLPGTMGEGVVVAILDTGINSDHPSFATTGGDGYTHTNPYVTGNYTPGSYCDLVDPFFCNDKLIGAWSFVSEAVTPEDSDSHGSHTASTVAGNVVTATVETSTTAHTEAISGVAPHANIIAYDVCVVSCPGGATLAAVNQVVVDHMALPNGIAAINYSISGGANPYYDGVELAFLAATDAGIFVSAAAGNSGPTPSTVSHLSPWVATTAASTHNRFVQNTLMDLTNNDGSPGPADMAGAGFTSDYGPVRIVYAGDYPSGETGTPELCGVGAQLDFNSPWPPGTFNGEIVVCDRGIYGRVEKGANVLAAGAGGYILANVDAQGEAIVSDGHVLPAVHIGDAAGDVLRGWLAANVTTTITATISGWAFNLDPANGDIMADFSSRGPAGALDVLKPDITAPGVSIWAAYADGAAPNPPEYGFMGGTSMSSPHNAGAATLLAALHPEWTPAMIKSAMMTTSSNTTFFKEDGVTPADPFDLGSGRVALQNAGQAGLVLNETTANFQAANPVMGGDPGALNLANFYDVECMNSCSWTRTVSSTMDIAIDWMASVSAPVSMSLTVEPSSFTLAPYGTQVLTVTADVAGMTYNEWAFAEITLSGSWLIAEPNLEISKDDGGITVTAGASLTYTLSYTNSGAAPATNVVLTETVPANTSFNAAASDAGWTQVGATDTYILAAGTLSASMNSTATFVVDVDDPLSTTVMTIDNMVYIGDDYVAMADSASASTNVEHAEPFFGLFLPIIFGSGAPAQSPDTPAVNAVAGPIFGTVPDAHFPVVVVPVAPPPIIDVTPGSLESAQETGLVVTQPLTVANLGGSDLNWNFYEDSLPVNAPLADWSDNFDSYATGSEIIGQGGWEGWGGDPGAGATVTDTVSNSAPNSIDVAGPSDLVHQYSGYTTSWWHYTTNVYVPSTMSGDSYFILLNTYSSNWSTQVQFNSSTGLLVNDGNSGGQMPYITDQWVEIRV
ncbi:MAG: S8 family serine peptidase, partial [Chloroflexi bacterium]|nr:S8 family serine peptidase [Chloroflexota bacterium]